MGHNHYQIIALQPALEPALEPAIQPIHKDVAPEWPKFDTEKLKVLEKIIDKILFF